MKFSMKKHYKSYITIFLAILMMITTLLSVGFGALNQNMSIAGDVKYDKDMGNMIMEYTRGSSSDFHSSTYRDKITTVDFLDNKNIPSGAVESWDVSINEGTGKVMAWIINDPSNTGYYKLYIGADGDVVGNPESGFIFYRMSNVNTINFNNNFNTSEVINMSNMFKIYSGNNYGSGNDYNNNLTTINGLEYFDTSKVTDMRSMFSTCNKITNLNVTTFDTSKVTDMYEMFAWCATLTTLDVTNFNTSQVTDMEGMFSGCGSLATIDVTSFNTSQVTTMSGMFNYCTTLTSLDVTNFDTSQVTNMSTMFTHCEALTSLDVTNFETGNVVTMGYMFSNCGYLANLDVSGFNTSNVEEMDGMFWYCSSLPVINVSNWNTSKVTRMSYMFSNCRTVTNLDVSNFNTSNVITMSNMFDYCNGLSSLDVTNFNTSQVGDMSYMFGDCSHLITLNLTSFNTSQVTNMKYMFYYCHNLTKIKISSLWDISNVTTSNYMFYYCSNLPNFNSSYTDKAKAIPTFSGGYLTLDMEGKYFSIVPDSNSYTISTSETGYSSNQTINPSELTKWRVINSNRVGNLELVSENISSNKVYFAGSVGYSKLVDTLQTIASQYAKSGPTKSVRCIGYDGQTLTVATASFNGSTNLPPSTTSTPSPTSGTGTEYSSGVLGDTLYLKDYLLVKNVYGTLSANTVGTSTAGQYWLASRRYDYYSNTNYGFFGRNINEGGELTTFMRLRHYFDGWIDSTNGSGIRPIMTLNNNITITGGAGTKSNPFTLS